MDLEIRADELQEIVALCDADGILLSWNKAAEEVTGFASEEVVGYHMDSIVAPGSRDDLRAILGAQKTGIILPGMPMRLQTSFGMEVPVEVTSVPQFTEGKPSGWLLVFRDTTLKVQLQEELDRMDILYRSLVEQSPAIVYVLDAAGRVLFINDTIETLLGYPKSKLIGSELIEIVHPEDRPQAYWPLRERRRSPRGTRNLELRLMTREGAPRTYDLDFVYVSLSAVGLGGPVLRPEAPRAEGSRMGEVLGTQGIARDITELVVLRDFSRQVGLILPVCSVCRRIRVSTSAGDEWLPLDEYVTRKTGLLFSHTFCPDHLPGA